MRFQVPQNLDVPDTVLFGLGFGQLIYIGGSFGLCLFLLAVVKSPVLLVLVGLPIVLFALFLSFFSHNKQSSIQFLQAIISFVINKKMYIWHKEGSDELVQRKIVKSAEHNEVNRQSAQRSVSEAEKISNLNDQLIFEESQTDNDPKVDI